MLKRYLNIPFLFIVITFRSQRSFAFDPVTAAMTVQSAQTVMGQIDEAANTGFSLVELLSELGIETDSEKDLQGAMDRLGKINSEARDLKWAQEDLNNSIENELKNGKNLDHRIRGLREVVRASKQFAAIFGFRPKAVEKSMKIQDVKINSMILEELQSIRRGQYVAYLEDKELKLQREVYLEKILQKEKGYRPLKKSQEKHKGEVL